MHLLVDLKPAQLRKLDRMAKKQGRSRAVLIRDAVAAYVDKHDRAAVVKAFGLWRERSIDGTSLQEELRSEW